MTARHDKRSKPEKKCGESFRRIGALDPIFHERSRLSIMTLLAANPGGIAFTELRDLCGLTDGNLSRHLRKLAEAGLVRMEKRFVRGIPNTTIQMSAAGIEQFSQYVEELAGVVEEANQAVRAQKQSTKRNVISELRESS